MFVRRITTPVPPKEARLAVSVAKQCAATNGCEDPVFSEAWLGGGVWHVILKSGKSGSEVVVQVSPEGQVVLFSGSR